MKSILKNYDIFACTKDYFSQLSHIKKIQESEEINFPDSSAEQSIKSQFEQSQLRLLIFDYDGTLVPLAKLPENALPTEDILSMLHQLTNDPKTMVSIVSGWKNHS